MSRATVLAALLLVAAPAGAQPVATLSLRDAESRALQNHPQILAGQYTAQAGDEATREARSAYFPTVYGAVTGADAKDGSRIAAGGLNNPIILDRVAAGVSVSQLLTDFGRTSDLVQTASLRAQALQQNVVADRADVLLRVDRAYFSALRAQAILRVAADTVAARQLVTDQVGALAQSNLKSGLDLSFAKVNLSEAQLLLVQARNDQAAAFATLAAALGQSDAPAYALAEEPLPAPPPADEAAVIARALRERSDVASERLARESAAKFAEAEHALWMPTISAAGAAGVAPFRQIGLSPNYAAIGVNVSVPLTNGGLFAARHTEASLRAQRGGRAPSGSREPGHARRAAGAARRAERLSASGSDESAPRTGLTGAGAGRGAVQPRAQFDCGAHAGAAQQDPRRDRAGERPIRLPGPIRRAAVSDRRSEVVSAEACTTSA